MLVAPVTSFGGTDTLIRTRITESPRQASNIGIPSLEPMRHLATRTTTSPIHTPAHTLVRSRCTYPYHIPLAPVSVGKKETGRRTRQGHAAADNHEMRPARLRRNPEGETDSRTTLHHTSHRDFAFSGHVFRAFLLLSLARSAEGCITHNSIAHTHTHTHSHTYAHMHTRVSSAVGRAANRATFVPAPAY